MTKQKVTDAFLDFKYHFIYVSKVLMFQAALILMILGVFYICNFKVQVVPLVQVVSPIVEGK